MGGLRTDCSIASSPVTNRDNIAETLAIDLATQGQDAQARSIQRALWHPVNPSSSA